MRDLEPHRAAPSAVLRERKLPVSERLRPVPVVLVRAFAAAVQVSGLRRIESGEKVCAMREKTLRISCVYSECSR